MTKDEIIIAATNRNIMRLRQAWEESMDEWGGVILVKAFTRFLIWNEASFSNNENPMWENLNWQQKQDKFFKEIKDYL